MIIIKKKDYIYIYTNYFCNTALPINKTVLLCELGKETKFHKQQPLWSWGLKIGFHTC